MNNTVLLTKAITDMFMAFPAANRTSADQVRVYVQELSQWPASVVSRAIQAARRDENRNKAFPPSLDEIHSKLWTGGMTMAEREQRVALLQSNNDQRQIGK